MRVATVFFLGAFVLFSGLTAVSTAGISPAQEFQFPAESFVATKGEAWQILTPPVTVVVDGGNPHRATPAGETSYEITEAHGDIIGDPTHTQARNADAGPSTQWAKYVIDVPESGEWQLWARVIALNQADNGAYWGFDLADADVNVEDDAQADNPMNLWDFYEDAKFHDRFTAEWEWHPLTSRHGPFPGTEAIQRNNDTRVGVQLTSGSHTFHLAFRETVFIDHFWATTDQQRDANADPPIVRPPTAVEPQGKLTTTWGSAKQGY